MKKLLWITVFCTTISPLLAGVVLDQAQEGTIYGFAYDNDSGSPDTAIRSQTFIPTVSTLEQLDLYLEVWQRNDGNGGTEKPYGDTIAANIVIEDAGASQVWNYDYNYDGSEGFFSGWVSVSAPSVALTPGQTYNIIVTGHGVWRGDSNSDYPGIPDVVDAWPNYDYAFRTFGVPEPTSMLLLGAGVFALIRKK